jgi:ABC-2 type transport system ATP-binding protein
MNAICFEGLEKSFRSGLKRVTAIRNLSFTVAAGEIFGFLGPNGAGKSTSIKILMNFIRSDAGRVRVNGSDVAAGAFQQHVGYLPETPCFYENLTGMETLIFAGRAYGRPADWVRQRAGELLRRLKLDHAAANRIGTYSKGMKQRLGLAVSLVHDPDILILDEPMSGLDPMGRKLITDVILELKASGKTVFFSSHILSDIERLCDRIGILNRGRLLYCGSVAEARQHHADMEKAFIHYIEASEKENDG